MTGRPSASSAAPSTAISPSLPDTGIDCTALGMGEAHIVDADGQRRRAACMGGLLSVLDGEVRLVATTWEWAEEIDQARAEASKKRAEEILAQKNLAQRDYELAQARLKRALVRTSIH